MKKLNVTLATLVATLVLVAAPAGAQERGHEGEADAHGEGCPWADPDVEVSVNDTEEGVAVVFRGPAEKQEELRSFAQRAAAMREHMRERDDRRSDGMTKHGGIGQMMMQMPPGDVIAEDVEGGARLKFTPEDPGDLERLREHVRDHAQMMRESECPMTSRSSDE